jgi:DNA repair photolyase
VANLTRAEFDAGAVVKKDFLARLEKEARKYQEHGVTEQVLLAFSTDPYPPAHHIETRKALETLIERGLAFCTLTKGGERALRDIDLFRPDRDAFASSLTSLDAGFSRKWERAAADPADRIATLRAFCERGIFTWVSLEPTLDVEASLAIVDATHEFVDLYKVGRVNYIGLTRTTDWRSYTLRMLDRLTQIGARFYFKKDLQSHLPAGVPNPLRVSQYHGSEPAKAMSGTTPGRDSAGDRGVAGTGEEARHDRDA